MTKKKPDAWDLFNSMFKEGERVVVIDDDDEFHWGRLGLIGDEKFHLKRRLRKPAIFYWEDIRFMGHDGFPVRKLRGADGSPSLEDFDTSELQMFLRTTLRRAPRRVQRCKVCGISAKEEGKPLEKHALSIFCPTCHARRHKIGYWEFGLGDPYLIEGVQAQLHYPGNIWTPDNWQYQETLMLYAPDGAKGMLWDIPTIYFAEVA